MSRKQDRFINTLANLSVAWHKLPKTGYRDQRGNLRFGQYVMNSNALAEYPQLTSIIWPELFYAEDYNEAYGMLYQFALQIDD